MPLESPQEFVASSGRLDQVVSLHSGASRSQVQHWIGDGQVWVGHEKITKAGHKLKGGEIVRFIKPLPKPSEALPEEVDLEILFEDSHLIAINKPPGVITHPTHSVQQGTLVNALLGRMSPESRAAPWTDEGYRPGIVHRLDKDTSGVIVVAKTVSAHAKLADAFKERLSQKTYLAITLGKLEGRPIHLDAPVGRHPTEKHKMAVSGTLAREAQTDIYPLQTTFNAQGQQFTFLRCQPKTGRTHQIRVHLAYLKVPVLGDSTYGRPSPWIRRQALHAWKLEIPHPETGEILHLEAPLPADMLDTWLALGGTRPVL